MELLFFWLVTSGVSFSLEMANELRLFKDVADAGYKIDIKRISEIGKQLIPNATKITLLSLLIPIYNILQVFKRTIQYNNIRPMVLDQLTVIDVLEEMTEMEKSEYQKRPTGLNALIIPLKMEVRLAQAESIKIEHNNEQSEIVFEMDESLDDITILKVSDSVSKLSVEEQKKIVSEIYKEILKQLENDINIEEDKNEEEITSNISSQLQANEQLEKQYLQNDKEQTLIRKR